jgi:dUTP pyrophosphatase
MVRPSPIKVSVPAAQAILANRLKKIFVTYGDKNMKTVLSKKDIFNFINQRPPLIENYISLEDQLQPNGFDLTLKEVSLMQTAGQIGATNSQRAVSQLLPLLYDEQDFLSLDPGAYVITFNEIVNLPKNVMALGASRSSLLRCGVTVQNAVWDAGYHGRSQALMVVHNPRGFRVQRNARVDQLVFIELAEETTGYNGIYQGENTFR